MKYYLRGIIMYLILMCSSAIAQTDADTGFVPDRPGVATPPAIVSARKFQIENGIQYSSLTNGDTRNENYQFSSLLVRYGLIRRVELRLATNYACNLISDSTGTNTVYGLTPLVIGTKVKLIDQHKVVPGVSFMFNLTLSNTGTRAFDQEYVAPSFYLLMSNDLTEKLNLCYNYGMVWDGNTAIPTHSWAVCLGISMTGKLNAFVEGFGFASLHTSPGFYMDTGLSYLINDHLQADASVAGFLNSFRDYFLVSMGIAWKIQGKNSLNRDRSIVKPTERTMKQGLMGRSAEAIQTSGMGKGACIWEPLNKWSGLFDRSGSTIKLMQVYDDLNSIKTISQ